MSEVSTDTRMELDSRSSDGLKVTLIWELDGGEDRTIVCVRDRRAGTYFEILTELYLPLDVSWPTSATWTATR